MAFQRKHPDRKRPNHNFHLALLFNSIEFALFLPIIFALYWFVTNKQLSIQNSLLLFASYFFYAWWDWRFLSLIIFSSAVDYLVGLKLGTEENPQKRKGLLLVSLLVNLGFLGFFKYYNFFIESFTEAFTLFGNSFDAHRLNIILPVGISFYTFQTLSYTIDIYKKQLEPTKDIIAFFAFVSFFPQLVAGPIERASNLLPQFLKNRQFDYDQAIEGSKQILIGLFKKVVIADRLAVFVDLVYANPSDFSGFQLLIATIFFTFQIYCDFSGYSDIAIGTAKLFGFDLMKNFDMPYLSKTLGEFWRRWHISLSTWFRDYVYIPLGGNRVNRSRWYSNIFITFTVSGLWHGANWTFVVWGALHGFFLVLERIFQLPIKNKAVSFLRIIYIFIIVAIAWVFFRANNLSEALLVCNSIFDSLIHYSPEAFSFKNLILNNGLNRSDMILSFLFIIGLMSAESIYRFTQHKIKQKESSWAFNLVAYSSLVFMLVLFHTNSDSQSFIYFQF